MNTKKARESNFELLKIISIFFVISLHICTQSGITDAPVSMIDDILFRAFAELGRTACSVFVMASAWFLCDSDFKTERIFRIWFKTLVYILVFYFLIFHSYDMPWNDFFPVGGGILWFVSAYISMLLFSPVLNAVLNHCSGKYVGLTILITGIPMLLYATFSLKDGFLGNYVVWFMWLYLLIGYLKKYPLKFTQNRFLMTAVFLILYVCRLFPGIEVRWSGRFPFFEQILPTLEWYNAVLWTLPNFLTAASMFFIFSGLKIRNNRIINFFGFHTLAIYIMHQMPFFYEYLWNGIFHCRSHAGTPSEIPYMFFVIICLFTVFSLADAFFDRLIFNPVFSLLKGVFTKIDSGLK